MIRIVIQNLFLFLLPTLLYLMFMVVRQRREDSSFLRIVQSAPFLPLSVIGLVFMIVGLAVFGSHDEAKPGQAYRPPVFKDGKVRPGGWEDAR